MHVGHSNKCSSFLDACFTLNSDKVCGVRFHVKKTSPPETHGWTWQGTKTCVHDVREGLSRMCVRHTCRMWEPWRSLLVWESAPRTACELRVYVCWTFQQMQLIFGCVFQHGVVIDLQQVFCRKCDRNIGASGGHFLARSPHKSVEHKQESQSGRQAVNFSRISPLVLFVIRGLSVFCL